MPIPACNKPVTITEENWTTQARQVIISYLDENKILWIFYEIMPCAPSEAAKYTAMKKEAERVDEIEALQNADFLSQHDQLAPMFKLVAGATPVKKTPMKQQSPSATDTSPTSATDIK